MNDLYMKLDDAVKRVNLLCKWEFGKDCVFDETILRQELEQICQIPSPADVVERKCATDKGYESSYGWVDVCSLCGCEFTTSKGANYCPNCGAKLDDEEYEQEIIDARRGEE